MKKLIFYCLLFLSVILPHLSYSQVTHPFVVYPRFWQRDNVEPAKVVPFALHLSNTTDEAIEVEFVLEDFQLSSEEDSQNSLIDWVHFEEGTGILLKAKESKDIVGTIDVPEDVIPGTYYGRVVFRIHIGEVIVSDKINPVAVLVINVNETSAQEDIQLVSFRTDQRNYDYGPVVFITRLYNIGDVLVKPEGEISIVDFRGQPVATLPVTSRSLRLLPNDVAREEQLWEESLIKDPFRYDYTINVLNEFALDLNHILDFPLGSYNATLTLRYGPEKSKTLTASTGFFFFPWRFIVYTVGSFILLFILIRNVWLYLFRKQEKKKVVQELRNSISNPQEE